MMDSGRRLARRPRRRTGREGRGRGRIGAVCAGSWAASRRMAERGGELREQEMRKNVGGLMKARASKSAVRGLPPETWAWRRAAHIGAATKRLLDGREEFFHRLP